MSVLETTTTAQKIFGGEIPDSRYALINRETGEIAFFEVQTGKGKWAGFRFVSRLIGAPGDFRKYPVKGQSKAFVLEAIGWNPLEAAVRFSREFTVCAVCGSALSDADSLARGLGPVCAAKF